MLDPIFIKKFTLTQCVRRGWDKISLFTENTSRGWYKRVPFTKYYRQDWDEKAPLTHYIRRSWDKKAPVLNGAGIEKNSFNSTWQARLT